MAPIRKGDGTPLEIPGVSEVRSGDGRVFFEGDAIPDKAGIAIAGRDADGDQRDTVYRFDDGWETIDPLPEPRNGLAATQDAEGRPLAIAGQDASGDRRETVYRFDDGWETIEPLPEPRNDLAAT